MDSLIKFWNYYNFDMVMSWVGGAMRDPVGTLMNPWISGPIIVMLGLLANKRTAGLGQKLVLGVPAMVYLFTTLTVLKNDSISNAGPFMMALGAMFIIVGWLLYSRLLKS